MSKVEQHFVTFYSPGTFFAEVTEKPIESWNPSTAERMAQKITERYGAKPYGFRFTTRSRGDLDLDSKVSKTGPMYYIKGRVDTLADVIARKDPKDSILISNMECNGYGRVFTPMEGWRCTLPLKKGDVVLHEV